MLLYWDVSFPPRCKYCLIWFGVISTLSILSLCMSNFWYAVDIIYCVSMFRYLHFWFGRCSHKYFLLLMCSYLTGNAFQASIHVHILLTLIHQSKRLMLFSMLQPFTKTRMLLIQKWWIRQGWIGLNWNIGVTRRLKRYLFILVILWNNCF